MEKMIGVEQGLRKQLDDYGAKYEEFQESLQHSNVSFAKFKAEMDNVMDNVSNSLLLGPRTWGLCR